MVSKLHIVFAVIVVFVAEHSGTQELIEIGCAKPRQVNKVVSSSQKLDDFSSTKCSNVCHTEYFGITVEMCKCLKDKPNLRKNCQNVGDKKDFTIYRKKRSAMETTTIVDLTSEEPTSTMGHQSYNESSTANPTRGINVTEIYMTNSTSNVDLTTTKKASLCSPTTCYRGCYKLKTSLLKVSIKDRPDRQVVDCMAMCTKSQYVGLQIPEQSENGIWCHCLGNDKDSIKQKRDDKCDRTCSGDKKLACGSNNKFISVYQKVNQSPGNIQANQKPPAGVELYILITVVCLVGFSCLCVLSVFGFRKWKRYQESQEYEDDHYYSYCQVPCNEMATSCSIEGSSNVTYLKNYPAKLPPPRKIKRQSFANEASISEQVIPESDELEIPDLKKDEELFLQNKIDDNEQYFILEPGSIAKTDEMEDGYLKPKTRQPDLDLENIGDKPNVNPGQGKSYSVLEVFEATDEQYDNKLYNAMESKSSDEVITSKDNEQLSGDGIYNVLEQEHNTERDNKSSENS